MPYICMGTWPGFYDLTSIREMTMEVRSSEFALVGICATLVVNMLSMARHLGSMAVVGESHYRTVKRL